ncbi:MAG TPA: Rieske 2Fe-2S domain-containing protein [Actinomycetota bacterium]|nr:Rieske 2Fe-2S domain-containing protein [Actinomycetota bacterium]
MSVLALSAETFAVVLVAALFGLFVLLLGAAFLRARRAAPAPAAPGRPAAPPPPGPKPKVVLSRRDFFRAGLLTSLGVFTAQFGGASLAFLWPKLKGFGSIITVPDTLETIQATIRETKQPYYFGAGRFYLVPYDGDGDRPGGPYEGLTAAGLLAKYQKCAHLGCRVPFCEQSQWFECPCHGSKYNRAGEWMLGPAPTGLHTFKVIVEGNTVRVDTSKVITGPPRGTDTIHQAPEGPFCVGGAA